MGTTQVTVLLESADQSDTDMYLDDLRDLSSQLLGCMAATERTITDSNATLKHRLANLEQHSIGIAIAGPKHADSGDLWRATADLFNNTTRALQNGSPVDSRVGDELLRALRDMAGRFLNRGRSIAVGGVALTSQFIANIDKILSELSVSEGAIKGRVERLNIHKRNEFALYTPLSETGVICTFEGDLFDKVRDAVGRNVTVTGKLHFRGWAGIPERVNVSEIDIHPADDDLPTLASLRGLLSNVATNDLSAVEFVHTLRNGES